jgi:hypothetical protein
MEMGYNLRYRNLNATAAYHPRVAKAVATISPTSYLVSAFWVESHTKYSIFPAGPFIDE